MIFVVPTWQQGQRIDSKSTPLSTTFVLRVSLSNIKGHKNTFTLIETHLFYLVTNIPIGKVWLSICFLLDLTEKIPDDSRSHFHLSGPCTQKTELKSSNKVSYCKASTPPLIGHLQDRYHPFSDQKSQTWASFKVDKANNQWNWELRAKPPHQTSFQKLVHDRPITNINSYIIVRSYTSIM